MTTRSGGRVIIFRFGSIGDTVVALPCLKFLRDHYGDAERILLTNRPRRGEAPVLSVIDGMGLVDRAIAYAAGERSPLRLLALAREIRATGADRLIYLSGATDDARGAVRVVRDQLFFRACGIREIIAAPTTTDLRRPRFDRDSGLYEHEADRLARCLAPLGTVETRSAAARSLDLSAAERAAAARALADLPSGCDVIALAPGAKIAAKDWGEARWAALLERLGAGEFGSCALALVGGGEDIALASRLAAHWRGPSANLCGATSPRVTAAVLAHARLFIGTDGGPMHLAAAAGTRCVALFGGYNRPGHWYPMGEGHVVLRLEDLQAIGVEDVECAVAAMVA